MKKIFNSKNWMIALTAFIVLQAWLDMDYFLDEPLGQLGLPRISTIIRFIALPCIIVWGYFLQTENKKKTAILGISYGFVFLIYYIAHSYQASQLVEVMRLTLNFSFSWYRELVYLLTLTLPFGIMYCVCLLNPTEKWVKNITMATSALISVPILISNLFVFGYSTYEGKAVANIFAWFLGSKHSPRQLATKFFFGEGNTVGIVLFTILPLLYYFFVKTTNKREKRIWVALIFIQSLSMQILGTRVGTIGAVIVPAYFIVLYLVDVLLKNQKFKKMCVFVPIISLTVFGLILPYTPAIRNQKIDTANDSTLVNSGVQREFKTFKNTSGLKELVPGTVEYDYAYIYMFETYGIETGYINSVPNRYYLEWYYYTFDPEFWISVLEMDVYDRLNGRQIQRYFMDYKMKKLKPTDHLLGAGYSTFMNGSIILEQDFIQQWMTLGIIGFTITLFPWIALVTVFLWKLMTEWKKYFNLEIFVYGAALLSALGSAYVSGHTMDQFMTTAWIAVLAAILFNKMILNKDGDQT